MILLVLLIEHRRIALPALRRVPGADRGIFGFVGFTAGNPEKKNTQHEQQKPFHGQPFHFKKPDVPG